MPHFSRTNRYGFFKLSSRVESRRLRRYKTRGNYETNMIYDIKNSNCNERCGCDIFNLIKLS